MLGKKVIIVIFCLLIALAIRLFFFYSSIKPFRDGEKVDFRFILLKEPSVEGKFQKFNVIPAGRERVFITVPSFPTYTYGQEVSVKGVVKFYEVGEKNAKYGSTSAQTLLRAENVINTMFFPKIEAKEVWYLKSLAALRKNLITIFSSSLNPASESLMLGIVFGIRSSMPADLGEALKTTGVIHITAASGMNVTMVAGAVFYLLAGFFRRQVALIIGFVFVWVYAVLAGLEPSILRATIMSSSAFGAGLLGRQNTGILALLLTAIVMLFISPSLLTDVGFQLSCLSTLGIILFGQVIGGGQSFVDPMQKRQSTSLFGSFREDLQTTIAAQAGTLPILFSTFGEYNILSIVVNLLILWTIPILMILGAFAALIGLMYQPLGSLFLFVALPLLAYIEWIVSLFAHYPVFVQMKSVSPSLVIGYYCFFFSVFLFFRSKRS